MSTLRSTLLVAGVCFTSVGMARDVVWAIILGACLLTTYVFTGSDT